MLNIIAEKAKGANPIVFCDFDGTITKTDVWEGLISAYDQRDWSAEVELWKNGTLGSREWYELQLQGLPVSAGELTQYIDEKVVIDPDFAPFVATLRAAQIPLVVVSDGFDLYIKRVLAQVGLGDLPVWANQMIVVEAPVGAGTGQARPLLVGQPGWTNGALYPQFPHYEEKCLRRNGNCKCAHIRASRPAHDLIVYIGDSYSDVCPLGEVDHVFARDRLQKYCLDEGIAHIPFDRFADLRTLRL